MQGLTIRLRRAAGALLLALCLLAPALAKPPAVTDDKGNRIELKEPAQRIITLAPHAAELVFAAGAGDKLIGAVSYTDYPPEAERVPRVGGYTSLDYERILALRPDLVVAWHSGNGPRTIERLRQLGLTVYESEPSALEDVAHAIERIARLAGTEQAGAANAAAFRAKHAALAERYSEQPPVRTFYQIWNQPLMTINGEHLISEVMRLCGGRNVFADLGPLSATIDIEAVLKAAPEAIVASGMGEERPEWLDDWRKWPQLPAVEQDNLFFIPPDLIQRHSPRILQGAEMLCEQLEAARAEG